MPLLKIRHSQLCRSGVVWDLTALTTSRDPFFNGLTRHFFNVWGVKIIITVQYIWIQVGHYLVGNQSFLHDGENLNALQSVTRNDD